MIDFPGFLRAVREDHPSFEGPYSWQQRFAERCAHGTPPPLIAVPTGAGKTSAVDALVWALAHQADRSASDRTVGVRIVWAIDRRILVDEVHEHASALASLLAHAQGSQAHPLHDLACRLGRLSGGLPLVATRWRGGIDDPEELHGPLQPQVITSTVAQIGSRMLFRGYGLGERSLAAEAGLAACDTTICLDEAHLAEPFRQTVDAIRAHRAASEAELGVPGLRLVTLTATPQNPTDEAIRLDDHDREALGPRLLGPKSAKLCEPEGGEKDRVALLVAKTLEHLAEGAPTVACVVNTVRVARAVFDKLLTQLADEAIDLTLLVGPQRPADRNLVLERHGPTLFGVRPPPRPLVCVATQTFEVGLDADVTAMVTESASASAIVQRLGRLNRRGHAAGRATIVRDDDCWLYADDEARAWEWLRCRERPDGSVDVAVSALDGDPERPTPKQVSMAALLTAETLDLLVQTAPRPGPWADPDIEVFLRGIEADHVADIGVCWRSDLRPEVAETAADGYREMLLRLVPPKPDELITLSVSGARALLAARHPGAGASRGAAQLAIAEVDVEGERIEAQLPDPDGRGPHAPFVVLRGGEVVRGVFGGHDPGTTRPSGLQAGDVLVLPTQAGGVDEHGLAPRASSANDVAEDQRPTDVPVPVRITQEALGDGTGVPLDERRWREVARVCRLAEMRLLDLLATSDKQTVLGALVEQLHDLLPDHTALTLPTSGPQMQEQRLALRAIGPVDETGMPILDPGEDAEPNDDEPRDNDEADESLGDGLGEADPPPPREDAPIERAWVLVPVPTNRAERHDRTAGDTFPPPTVEAHALAVRAELQAFLDGIGLPPSARASLLIAANVHDHGKADPRIQAFYRRGTTPIGAPLIAKSEFGTRDPRTSRIAARLAGLPSGLRHEIASVAVLADAFASGEVSKDGLDPDLALHLVGTHHGLGRPVPRVPEGGLPARRFRVEAAGIGGTAVGDGSDGWQGGDWLERFWRVIERYGPWGTAYLEALLVRADRVVSARGS